ncbi:MAG: hypothetical protein A3E01_15375 [Gammaproteobacteria bacterium RIFCSPHIGHO2_12_FULL_63_22]|nr:MAG: hypothetical protein A3E01_15375 [Gammaproteobacteria bacterium RIFCSPHIGHO2_12_FULL_63_22]
MNDRDLLIQAIRNGATAWTPQEWSMRPAATYAIKFAVGGPSLTSGDAHELADYGFTTTTLGLTGGSGADVPDAGWSTLDWGTPGKLAGGDTTDLFQSPAIFADPMGFYEAAKCLNISGAQPPKQFVAEWWGALTTASADESTSGFGLVEAGGTAGTAANRFAWIKSDGTNLLLASGAAAATVVNALAVVTTMLLHRIVIDRVLQRVDWYTSTDGITFTHRAYLALEADELPVSFGAYSGTTNRFALYGTGFFYYI